METLLNYFLFGVQTIVNLAYLGNLQPATWIMTLATKINNNTYLQTNNI